MGSVCGETGKTGNRHFKKGWVMKHTFNNGTAYLGDSLKVVKSLESDSVDCVITSPPYYQLRDYGYPEQWGLEPDYKDYLDKMIELMRELKRVLKPTGTIWINLGDTYNTISGNAKMTQSKPLGIGTKISEGQITGYKDKLKQPMPSKSLMLIPHRFAMRCVDELGLILRNTVIWAKPNGMPESVTDRFTKKHEYIFFFTKNEKYYFDLDVVRDSHKDDYETFIKKLPKSHENKTNKEGGNGIIKYRDSIIKNYHKGKNPGDVTDFWEITTKPSSKSHYATYNSELIIKPLLAGSPLGGVVLDPFGGTGTTAFTAMRYERKFIYIDANKEYFDAFTKEMSLEDSQMRLDFPEAI